MKNRIIAGWLIVCMLVALFYAPGSMQAFAGTSYEVEITADGAKIDAITVPENEKKEIVAVCAPATDKAEYQWQICADIQKNQWVDIYEADNKTLVVSYALLSSALDDSGSAYLRAKLIVGGRDYYSNSVCATVIYDAQFTSQPEKVYLEEQNSNPVSERVRVMAADVQEYVTITINYLDWESKKEIYSPYTATLEYGTAFQQDVISPTFLGYAPYTVTDEDGELKFADAGVYKIDYADGELTSDITINIYYKAIEVQYAVRYFFQNVNNDLYTERTDLYRVGMAETGTIITDEVLGLNPEITQGFSKLYHYPESVAADGSTVFECYYDRNYYMLKFDMKGGYGVDPIYARYGTPYVVPDPIKPGYIFDGWDLYLYDDNLNGEPDRGNGEKDDLLPTIEVGNKNYGAIWKSEKTTFTVAYWLENADDQNGDLEGNGYSYLASKEVEAMSGSTVNAGNYRLDDQAVDIIY